MILPSRVDLTEQFPGCPVYDQGELGSDAACALSAAAWYDSQRDDPIEFIYHYTRPLMEDSRIHLGERRVIDITTGGDTEDIEVWFSEDEVAAGIFGRYLNFRNGDTHVKLGMGNPTIQKVIDALTAYQKRQ